MGRVTTMVAIIALSATGCVSTKYAKQMQLDAVDQALASHNRLLHLDKEKLQEVSEFSIFKNNATQEFNKIRSAFREIALDIENLDDRLSILEK